MKIEKASMLVTTPTLKRHRDTGRMLNHFPHDQLFSMKELTGEPFLEKMRAFTVAEEVSELYRTTQKGRGVSVEFIKKVVIWMFFHPDKKLSVSIKDSGLGAGTLRKVINWLHDEGWVVNYSGFASKYGAKSGAILPTEKLLKGSCTQEGDML